ncbi:MAG: substrate-binding domain-containing protein, partial [Azoarcus sp.]|nr:substrate-binding domain-containing protein [Azoarcus sp.]
MSAKKYWVSTLALTIFGLPIVALLGIFLALAFLGAFEALRAFWPILVFVVLLASAAIAFLYGKKADLPDKFIARYGPFIAPIVYVLLAWIIVSSINGGDFTKPDGWFFTWLFWPFVAYLGVVFMIVFSGNYWVIPAVIVASQIALTASFAFGSWRVKRFATRENRYAAPVFLLVLALMAVSGTISYVQYHSVFHADPGKEVKEDSWLGYSEHLPFIEDNSLVHPRQTPSLVLDHDYPRLDGALALLPVYAAAAQAIYVKDANGAVPDIREEAVECSNTPAAYERLISGKTDMIFVAAPSDTQQELAARHGVHLTLTPIAKEAFVFLINEQHPVKNLSVDQIRAIYSGEIEDWNALGGHAGKILAFQRNKNSGSQTAMEQLVMRGMPMRKPLKAERYGDMGGILRDVADYRNYANAIGYSFRFYATAMNTVPDVALLSVNGVAPTPENIRN